MTKQYEFNLLDELARSHSQDKHITYQNKRWSSIVQHMGEENILSDDDLM